MMADEDDFEIPEEAQVKKEEPKKQEEEEVVQQPAPPPPAMQPKPKDTGPVEPPWIVSFIDTLSLLLTFFVLLFSMSTLDKAVWQEVMDSLDSAFKEAEATGGVGRPLHEAVPEIFRRRAINLDYLSRILATQITQNELREDITIQRLEDRLIISLPSDLLFAPARADLKPEARPVLVVLGGILRNVKNRIEIYGHTDPSPLRGGEYTSNWELSMGRAQALAARLYSIGLRRNIHVLGFADAKFSILNPQIPEYEKFALSRRVDIVIYPYVL